MDTDAINWNGKDCGWEESLAEKKSHFQHVFDTTVRYQSGDFKKTSGHENPKYNFENHLHQMVFECRRTDEHCQGENVAREEGQHMEECKHFQNQLQDEKPTKEPEVGQ